MPIDVIPFSNISFFCEWHHGEAGTCGVKENISSLSGSKLRVYDGVFFGTEVMIPENDSAWFASRHICRTFRRDESI